MPSAAYHQNPSAYFEASAYRGFDLAQPATGLVLFGRIALMPRKQTPRNDLKHRSIAAPYSAPLAAVEIPAGRKPELRRVSTTPSRSVNTNVALLAAVAPAPCENTATGQSAAAASALILQALRARMCARSSSASAASLAKASTSGSVATRTEFVAASAISRASASPSSSAPSKRPTPAARPWRSHCGLSVFYRHPSGDRCSFGRCSWFAASFFLARRGLGIFFCTGRPSSSTTLPSMRRSVVRRRTAPNSPRYCAMRANALSRRISNEAI